MRCSWCDLEIADGRFAEHLDTHELLYLSARPRVVWMSKTGGARVVHDGRSYIVEWLHDVGGRGTNKRWARAELERSVPIEIAEALDAARDARMSAIHRSIELICRCRAQGNHDPGEHSATCPAFDLSPLVADEVRS